VLINLKKLIKKYKLSNKGVIHVGGHRGQELKNYDRLRFKNIHVFEPLIENFNILQKVSQKLFFSRINTYNIALGSSVKSQYINLSSNKLESSSFLKPQKHLLLHPKVTFFKGPEIKINKLDNYNIDNCNFLNIDVQGYELEVLKGATKTLKEIQYINCEVNCEEVYKEIPLIGEIDNFLSKYNFKRVELIWARSKLKFWKKLPWGDAFYLKSDKSIF